MIALSSVTREHVLALFDSSDVDAAVDLLERECADNVNWPNPTPGGLERVRFAALRYCGGRLHALREAIALARTDWRDLLVAAGFSDLEAHKHWRPVRFDGEVLQRWFEGERPPGTEFGVGEAVIMAIGPHQGRNGTIVSLAGLEPEPRYEVQWETGKQATVWQRSIAPR